MKMGDPKGLEMVVSMVVTLQFGNQKQENSAHHGIMALQK